MDSLPGKTQNVTGQEMKNEDSEQFKIYTLYIKTK